MPLIKRRRFLQFAGSTLATIGLSQFDLMNQGDRYAKVLAQTTPRKLALLVGINKYPAGIPTLGGCLTDVEMQRELLTHRFGFNSSDILTIADNTEMKPTRQNILNAFENHLIKQAKPGDVVVFHYSGHGSLVIDPSPLQEFGGRDGTIVPYDRMPQNTRDVGKVQDITGRSLFLLMQALNTENVTVVLDSCHSGGGSRGNLVFRSIPSRLDASKDADMSDEELEYQQRWLSDLKLSKTFDSLRRKGIAKGVAIGSAQYNQLAADAPFDGFNAGAFTYLLTRYLWQQTANQSIGSAFANLGRLTKDVANSSGVTQEPVLATHPKDNEDKPTYFLKSSTPSAEAVVRGVKNGQIEFWLGGVSSQSLAASNQGSIFTLIDLAGKELGKIEQTSRVGLVGYGKLQSGNADAVKAGTFLREEVRGVPTDLTLRIGVDRSLQNESPQAELKTIKRVEVVTIGQQADYLLGRFTEETLRQAKQSGIKDLPPVGSVGLFTAGLLPISGSFGRAGESASAAVNRLRPRFQMLLAGRILQLAATNIPSDLKVTVTVAPIGNRGAADSFGSRGAQEAALVPRSLPVQKLKPGTNLQVQVTNRESRNLYMSVLVIGSDGDITVLFPVTWSEPEASALIAPGKTLSVPRPEDKDINFTVQGPSGALELLVLASTEPLRNALKGLQAIAKARGIRGGYLPLQVDEPVVEVMGSLLGDLNNLSRATVGITSGGIARVNGNQLVALSTTIEVVE
ncbi:caspase family protein [Phormidesmis priestleyi]